MENNELKEKLNQYIGRKVIINQLGFLQSQYTIEKLKYSIEYEILSIIDEVTNNYIKMIFGTEGKITFAEMLELCK